MITYLRSLGTVREWLGDLLAFGGLCVFMVAIVMLMPAMTQALLTVTAR